VPRDPELAEAAIRLLEKGQTFDGHSPVIDDVLESLKEKMPAVRVKASIEPTVLEFQGRKKQLIREALRRRK
jgi:hypothetical protein